jgi:glucose/mannose-6-phosphate isomerase
MNFTPEQVKQLDPADMYTKIYDFPRQLQEGFGLPIKNDLSGIKSAPIKNIVIAGMGGSAIGGDILRSYVANDVRVPILINRNYGLPRFVDKDTLLIASSYSGNTEESLAAFAEGEKLGCKIFVATTGGKLGDKAVAGGYPHVILPAGYQPRAALGYSFGPVLNFLEQAGFVSGQRKAVDDACQFLAGRSKDFALDLPEKSNFAKQAASKLQNKIGIVYAGADYYDTTAIRFKGQICENAKALAYANICPEFNHNELVGFEYPQELLQKLVVIFLTGPADTKGVTNRFKIINEIVGEKGIETIFIKAEGPNRLAEIFSLIQVGDFVSYYLALLNGTDPSPVHVINRLKSSLEKMN